MNSEYVSAAKPGLQGGIFMAPLGTELPADAKTALAAVFLPLGYVSEEGVINSNSPSSSQTKAWGGDVVLDSQTEKPDTFKFAMIEALNVNVLKLVYGDKNVTGTLKEGIHVMANRDEATERVMVVDMALKESTKRIVIPRGKVTQVDDIVYKDGKAIAYGVTISAAPYTDGNTHHEYILPKT